ncbi:hypothetical protein [Paraburkholderia sediminicola]|uniref:hypothetical protein n=1 Tax=Paraburkholderia sediminicola TaxID=458836 RepID=UPI0038BA34E7
MITNDVSSDGDASALEFRTTDAYLFFERAAENIVRSFTPRKVIVVGNKVGLLVEALWDRGIETVGVVGSTADLEDVRIDVRSFCITAAADAQHSDLIVWLDTRLLGDGGDRTQDVAAILKQSDRLLVAPIGKREADTIAPLQLVQKLKRINFDPVLAYDAGYLGVGAFLFEVSRGAAGDPVELARHIESIQDARRQALAVERLSAEIAQDGASLRQSEAANGELKAQLATMSTHCNVLKRELLGVQHRLSSVLNTADATAASLRQRRLDAEDSAECAERAEHAEQEQLKFARYAEELKAQLDEMHLSTSWRVTKPIRVFGMQFPLLASVGRKIIKVIYWTITLQLLERLRRRREFRRQLHR